MKFENGLQTSSHRTIRVLFVCHGNICRSTMAESVMAYLVKKEHLEGWISVNSAATSTEEIGNPPHYGTVGKLREVGIPLVPHRAVQLTKSDYVKYDYLIGMDAANLRNMNRMCGGDPLGKMYSLLSFAGKSREIADPWYTGNFDATYEDVMEGCTAFLEFLKREHGGY